MGLDRSVQGAPTDKDQPFFNNSEPDRLELMFSLLQVGFKNPTDYETFVWVREEELPEVHEVIQVKQEMFLNVLCEHAH